MFSTTLVSSHRPALARATAAILLAMAALAPARAAIINNPASIIDHGSYITDTANKRDWYKFSNALNTIGWSMDAWKQTYGNNGWSVASEAEVNGLKMQYGWIKDTPAQSFDASNFGLTSAIGEDLGFTVEWTGGLDNELGGKYVDAMTSAGGSVEVNGAMKDFSFVSSLRTYSYNTGSGIVLHGDEVNSEAQTQYQNMGQEAVGIWLSRASADVTVDVPEPGSAPLMLLGLGGLVALRRSRSWALKRQHVSRAT